MTSWERKKDTRDKGICSTYTEATPRRAWAVGVHISQIVNICPEPKFQNKIKIGFSADFKIDFRRVERFQVEWMAVYLVCGMFPHLFSCAHISGDDWKATIS